ncbi:hypothetical protein F4782DRAFT_504050 [Xylaria castorea]|nr:hypothetical protein F4782DRAFT_504050 [Xylaria castorea]
MFVTSIRTWLRDRDGKEEWSLEVALSKPIEIVRMCGDHNRDQNGAAQKALIIFKAEQRLMADLLYKLFHYEPEKRLSVEEVLVSARVVQDGDWGY